MNEEKRGDKRREGKNREKKDRGGEIGKKNKMIK